MWGNVQFVEIHSTNAFIQEGRNIPLVVVVVAIVIIIILHRFKIAELEGTLWIIKSSPCQGGTPTCSQTLPVNNGPIQQYLCCSSEYSTWLQLCVLHLSPILSGTQTGRVKKEEANVLQK